MLVLWTRPLRPQLNEQSQMPVRLDPWETYRLLKERLSSADQLALGFHERTIAADPDLGFGRRKSDDGAILDYRVYGLVIKYWRISPDVVALEWVLDLGEESLPPDVVAELGQSVE